MVQGPIELPVARQQELQALLETLAEHVYFQPPSNFVMQYPCIVYGRDRARTLHANNNVYRHVKGYQVTVISQEPDDTLPDKVAGLPLCSFDRHYTADNLNHDVFILYF
jgi:hypothetical protein